MNKTRLIDFKSLQLLTAYDTMGRVVSKQQWTSGAWSPFAGFEYTAKGQRAKMKDAFTGSIGADKYVEYA